MFRRFAGSIPGGANELFLGHPSVLSSLLEVGWQVRVHDTVPELGHPVRRSHLASLPDFWLDPLKQAAELETPSGGPAIQGSAFEAALERQKGVLWDHLIYAYMIENTAIFEIFERVLQQFVHGETQGVPSAAAQHWLRNTEELFFRDPASYSITAISSQIRPNMRATRRNAYWRMFGMDLNHGTEAGQPYPVVPYVKAEAANNGFQTVFEELLREVWVAIVNRGNESGVNPTDKGKIENLVEQLHEMLMTRRINGNLSREEYVAVAAMSWFHLTVSFNSPIVESLRAQGASAEQRLFKVAQRVGLPAHGLSKSFFDIADAMSRILILIEASPATEIVPGLVAPGGLQDTMNTIITHWSKTSRTGRNIKSGKVAVKST
jgi:hypothetical protein